MAKASKLKEGGSLGRFGKIARNRQASLSLAKKLEFVDIIESMIDLSEHSNTEVIEMVRLMQNEMDRIKARHSNIQ